jgi:hypothetical protein
MCTPSAWYLMQLRAFQRPQENQPLALYRNAKVAEPAFEEIAVFATFLGLDYTEAALTLRLVPKNSKVPLQNSQPLNR